MPPSIAAVPTAVPAFLGYTEKAAGLQPTRIENLRDYEQTFGGPPEAIQGVVQTADAAGAAVYRPELAPDVPLLYDSLRLYFENGGGPCYIVAVGGYSAPAALVDFQTGLDALKAEDEPTLIVMPDATRLADGDFRAACGYALDHCGLLRDRFAILDVKRGMTAADFRQVSSAFLSYGAAYTPYLATALPYVYDEDTLNVSPPRDPAAPQTLSRLRDADPPTYLQIKGTLDALRLTLPPSGAMAGIYASVDRTRGVWKAPAGVAVNSVLGVDQNFTDAESDLLNVDAASGKSICVIRNFAGRGVLVWGARTLAGNDGDWRYVSVRRFFIMIEESVKRATASVVFEPNTAETWLKVKAMVEGFLYGLWQQGALPGTKPEEAYFVQAGLGTTMTAQDILDGRMNVTIGVAPLQPAEFVVIQLSQQMQTS